MNCARPTTTNGNEPELSERACAFCCCCCCRRCRAIAACTAAAADDGRVCLYVVYVWMWCLYSDVPSSSSLWWNLGAHSRYMRPGQSELSLPYIASASANTAHTANTIQAENRCAVVPPASPSPPPPQYTIAHHITHKTPVRPSVRPLARLNNAMHNDSKTDDRGRANVRARAQASKRATDRTNDPPSPPPLRYAMLCYAMLSMLPSELCEQHTADTSTSTSRRQQQQRRWTPIAFAV